MTKHTAFLIFNFLGLQITWAACAYGAIHEFPLLGSIVGSIYIIIHMILTPSRRIDLLTLLCLSSAGILLDFINMKLGIISFNSTQQNFIPLWLVILWCVFSLMIPHSLNWLRRKPILACVLGGIGGSLSYWLGHKLGAIALSDPITLAVSLYFIEWAIYVPLAFIILRGIKQTSFDSSVSEF